MVHVRIIGFKHGLQKIAMTKAIHQHADLDLAAAKRCTDSVLIGEAVTVQLPTLDAAQALVDELVSLGAIAEVVH